MKRYASITRLKNEKIEKYKKLHANTWPAVLAMIKTCNIQNYSIHLRQLPDKQTYLFSYFEYVGANFEADMAIMAADETTQKWWEECTPCMNPIEDSGEPWASAEEVFYCG